MLVLPVRLASSSFSKTFPHEIALFDTTRLLEIISGRRNDVASRCIRGILGLLTPLYRIGFWFKNRKFDAGTAEIAKVDVPVISIGNITTGGTGKTPMVVWLCRKLRERNLRVAIVSRGYGRENTGMGRNDEALELEHRLPDVPHLQDPDRARMAETAVYELESEVIVLDDGFQHRKLHRDFDLVLIDATQPFGFGRVLPRGLLREPLSNLKRADAIVLTRSQFVDEQEEERIHQQIKKFAPQARWAACKTTPRSFLQYSGKETGLESLREQRVLAFCAVGNPKGFELTLNELRVNVADRLDFPDHHGFSKDDISNLADRANTLNVEALVCTHKDLVKIGVDRIGNLPVYALLIDLEFEHGENELLDSLESVCDARS